MRRFCAVLLVALISFLLLGPAFAASPENNLPACCRRGGKHHCSLNAKSGGSNGPALNADGRCPLYYAQGPAVAGSSVRFAVAAGMAVGQRPVARDPGAGHQSTVRGSSAAIRSFLSRGPPSLA
ncbi:MAG: hypothetical protein KGN84_05635 [Acidobacteriota bacterium]|nr:hypothetical protein [Acidobacteriota bacterium]